MSRLQKLAPILDLAERTENQAGQALAAGQQRLQAAQAALANLQGFRASYSGRFERAGQQGISVHRLHEFRGFLHKVNQAIAEQERSVRQIEAELAALRQVWEQAHRKVLGMQKVIEKLVVAEQQQEQRREQAEQDDRSGSRRGNGGKSLLSLLW